MSNKKTKCSIAICDNPARVTKKGKKMKRNMCLSCNRAWELGYKVGYYSKNKVNKNV